MKRIIALIAMTTTMVACTSEDDINNVQLRARMLTLSKEIETLIDTKCDGDVCTQQASCGCESLAYGQKPCGGPWQYIVYSLSSTDESLLKTKVNDYNSLNRQLNEEEGLISDCAVEIAPTISCVENQCQSTSL